MCDITDKSRRAHSSPVGLTNQRNEAKRNCGNPRCRCFLMYKANIPLMRNANMTTNENDDDISGPV